MLTDLFNTIEGVELQRMLRYLEASQGTTSFGISICNMPVLCEYFFQEVATLDKNIIIAPVSGARWDILQSVLTQLNGRQPYAIFLVRLEQALRSEEREYPVLNTLNTTRERWGERLRCPIVFWVPEYVTMLISIHAKQFWAWISHQFEFGCDVTQRAVGFEDPEPGGMEEALTLNPLTKYARIVDLKGYLSSAEDSVQNKLSRQIVNWHYELGSLLRSIGDLEQAKTVFRQQVRLCEKFHFVAEEAAGLNSLGLVFQSQGDKRRAINCYQRALTRNEDLKRFGGMVANYNNLGLIYMWQGEFDEAEHQFRQVLEVAQTLTPDFNLALTYRYLAEILDKRGDADSSMSMHSRSHALARRLAESSHSQVEEITLFYKGLQKDITQKARRPVNTSELGQLLAVFRETMGVERSQVEETLAEKLRQHAKDPTWKRLLQLLDSDGRCNFEIFEQGKLSTVFFYEDVRLFASVYGIHTLLLDHLFSQIAEKTTPLVVSIEEGFVPVGDMGDRFYGSDCQYKIAHQRLIDSKIALIYLTLDPDGHSDVHEHPGDELLLVMEGSVEIRFENSGMRVSLSKGDFVHFYSEQRHGVWNVSGDVASAFIVRGYSHEPEEKRKNNSEHYRSGLLTPDATQNMLKQYIKLFHKTLPDIPEFEHDHEQISQGLSLLQEKSVISDDMDRKKQEQLIKLAKIYNIRPILLNHFQSQFVTNAVVIRLEENPDWVSLSESVTQSEGVSYKIPRRNLAFSNITIALATLAPGAQTLKNSHPGSEIILPFSGRIKLFFDRSEYEISSKPPQYIHFQSDLSHIVANPGSEVAQFYVVRFANE